MPDIEQAVRVLESHIEVIHSVPDWAEKMKYDSPKYFTRKIRAHYRKSPYKLIVEIQGNCYSYALLFKLFVGLSLLCFSNCRLHHPERGCGCIGSL